MKIVVKPSARKLEEKKDACYHKVKSRYKVWPSAYASGALVKCRKVGAENWGKSTTKESREPTDASDGLTEGDIFHLPQSDKTDNSEKVELVNSLYDEFIKLQDVDDKNEIGMILLLNIRELPQDGVESINPKIDIQALEAKYGRIVDSLEAVLRKGFAASVKSMKEAKKKRAGSESSKESSLRDWFGRKGAKGKKKGWVDCNAPDGKGGYKACGRSGKDKRKKYPACRPTPGACKERGKGKSWGKKAKKRKVNEAASEYVYGVKNPSRVANIYKVRVVKK
tara:strand:+ start:1850 stop:2692 length:843 start_codon:yes stop_codon:yes gene_type:complete